MQESSEATAAANLMDLAAARTYFQQRPAATQSEKPNEEDDPSITAVDLVKQHARAIVVGAPGGGKSTLLEWLQLAVAAVQEEVVLAGQQAIPLLLRVRQLDPRQLPTGAALVEQALASKDRATLMPAGWIQRQMEAGRVLFMLDGLDETEEMLRDRYILPWLVNLCTDYPNCHYLISSRPVGYAPGTLYRLNFVESDLLDFGEDEARLYTRNWCTAVRLARNEPEVEARAEGVKDGDAIIASFAQNPYIINLARNPLMLSAICLVNYFEGGRLPEDRALLYQLCVEGLLHHWDQRRGIHSEFTLDEKLCVCREVALTMQALDRAEYEAENVHATFTTVLGDAERSLHLLEHIRYRSGLLLERRPHVFAFAHLIFQEYLAARAVHEGNEPAIDAKQLAAEHDDGRWQEVIALYCGLAPAPAAQELLDLLVEQTDTESLANVLAEAYFAAGAELARNTKLRKRILTRIALAPGYGALERFPDEEVAPIAQTCIGMISTNLSVSESFNWLVEHPEKISQYVLLARLDQWKQMTDVQIAEIFALLHAFGSGDTLVKLADIPDLYRFSGPTTSYGSQAEVALEAISQDKNDFVQARGGELTLLQSLRVIANTPRVGESVGWSDKFFRKLVEQKWLPKKATTARDLAALALQLGKRLETYEEEIDNKTELISALKEFAQWLNENIQDIEEGSTPTTETPQ